MGFNGTCFASHSESMVITPTHVDNINYVWANNAIWDDLYLGIDTEVLKDVPEAWDWTTVMWAQFNGTLNAGNLDYMLSQINALRIKRRIKGESQWITMFEIPVETVEDIQFYIYDNYVQWGQTYEYALVPVVDQIEAITVSREVTVSFNGMYITDGEMSYYTFAQGVINQYQRNHGGTALETLSRKYPYYIKNAKLDYDSGSAEGVFYPLLSDNCTISTDRLFDYRTKLAKFLLNGRAKILKDSFGHIWMVHITGDVTHTNGGHPSVIITAFNWSEIGDVNSQQDLYDYGFIKVAPHITGG